jgi:serine/threonine-protein kinase
MPPALPIIPAHRVTEPLAQRGTCTLFLGLDPAGDEVVIKVLHRELLPQVDLVMRFVNESLLLQRLRHPGLVQVRACGQLDDGCPFTVMERLGPSLHDLLRAQPRGLPLQRALRHGQQLAEAAAALHQAGVVHRDIKPDNALLTREPAPRAKLIDLGLARLGEAGDALPVSTAEGALFGTYEYMAPEQWASPKRVGDRADVYSLGVTLFELLTGRPPFVATRPQALMGMHLFEPPPDPLGTHPGLRPVLPLLKEMLRKDPGDRPSMAEVAARLARLARP